MTHRKPPALHNFPVSFTVARNAGYTPGAVGYVVDGDTFDVFLDLGFGAYAWETLRLRGIDTPEIYGGPPEEEKTAGHAAKSLVEGLVLDRPVLVRSYKDKETFGRYVADVWYVADSVALATDELPLLAGGIAWYSLATRLRVAGFDWSDEDE